MHITGIIAEYNPLHLGHQYHIEQTRTFTDNDPEHYIITVLSGDFVQRGLPAIIDKHTRTRMALEAGSDLVLELPVPYALSSGEGFAFGGVSLLHQLGCVDTISFGSEEGELTKIMAIARVLHYEQEHTTSPYQLAYQNALKQGLTHPTARIKALSESYPDLDLSVLDGHSNNMLALEYCKALLCLPSPIRPITVKRMGQAYLDTETSISQAENASSPAFASATAIREILSNTPATDKDISSDQLLKESISPLVRELLMDAHSHNSLIHPNDFSLLLHYKLLNLPKEQLVAYLEISDDFANKITKNLNHFESFTHFANLLWTKDTTYARVCRNLMNIILDIKNDTWDVHQPVPYARVLGFRKNSSALLSEIKKKSAIPLITKLADADKALSSNAYQLLELDMKSAHIYDSVIFQKTNLKHKHETQKQLIIL